MTDFDKHANLAGATVSPGSTVIGSAIGDTILAESIEVAALFPDVPFKITVWRDASPDHAAAEVMRATAYDGQRTFTVERAREGTAALANIGIGWRFGNTPTAGDFDAIEDAVNAEETTRAAADVALEGEIGDETAARIAGDAATLESAEAYTDAETTARQGAVTAEAGARVAGDAATLGSAHAYTDLETAARIAGDAATLAAAEAYADSGSITATAVKTANYSAAAGDFVPVDTTSGAVTVTLPNGPSDGTRVAVKHVIQGGANTVTIACAGVDVFNKAGGSTTLTLTLLNQGLILHYKASSHIWYVEADDLALSQLDLRYDAIGAATSAVAAEAATRAAADSAEASARAAAILGVPVAAIASATLASDAASIDFQNIPQTYARLLIFLSARTDEAAAQRSVVVLSFNGDSTNANYSQARTFGGNAFGGDTGASQRQVAFVVGDAGDASTFGLAVILVGQYITTKLKTALSYYGHVSKFAATAQGEVGITAAAWNNTAAINRITLAPANGNFRAGTTATLIGVSL